MASLSINGHVVALEKFNKSLKGQPLETSIYNLTSLLRLRQIQGSEPCAIATANLLLQVVAKSKVSEVDQLLAHISAVGSQLVAAQPKEPVVGNIVRRVLGLIRDEAEEDRNGGVSRSSGLVTPVEIQPLTGVFPPPRRAPILSPISDKRSPDPLLATLRRLEVIDGIEEIKDEIDQVDDQISANAEAQIRPGEYVLVYEPTLTVRRFLLKAASKRKFTVVTVIHPARQGSAESSYADLRKGLAKHGVSTINVCRRGNVARTAKKRGSAVVILSGVYKFSPEIPFDEEALVDWGNPSQAVNYSDGGIVNHIAVQNPTTELIPEDLVDVYITNLQHPFSPAFNDLPPPPYSETDIYSQAGAPPHQPDAHPPLEPSAAAAAYFDSRPVLDPVTSGSSLEHVINVSADSTPEAFPFVPGFLSRDVTEQDWRTFLNFLIPDHSTRSNEAVADRKLRAEGSNTSTIGEAEAQMSAIISENGSANFSRLAVERTVEEWNAWFFGPRGVTIHLAPEPSAARMPGAWDQSFDAAAAGPPGFQPIPPQEGPLRPIRETGIKYLGRNLLPGTYGPFQPRGRGWNSGGPFGFPDRALPGLRMTTPAECPCRTLWSRWALGPWTTCPCDRESCVSLDSLPDYDDLDGQQYTVYTQALQQWLARGETMVSKQDVRQLKADLRAARSRQCNLTTAQRKECARDVKNRLRELKQVRRQHKRDQKELKRQEKQRKRAEKREHKQKKRELKRSERENRHASNAGIPAPPAPLLLLRLLPHRPSTFPAGEKIGLREAELSKIEIDLAMGNCNRTWGSAAKAQSKKAALEKEIEALQSSREQFRLKADEEYARKLDASENAS
ncbi:unnamed protein product [Parascedosporium putredinis]|uniref:Translation initiation factor eIF2B subunit beta n=1 Tax=Parascedosporium putredinis TaxID=1442378 RepID=A0A9P1H3H5_9PEZI|nr:unnamed protein product [Parascedosporium putredinis]CAI7995847.1 unnamed protein product [Parascedosporium putredinis]